jgi:hypothetical protein
LSYGRPCRGTSLQATAAPSIRLARRHR